MIAPNSESLCAILSSTALTVLVMLCRARSDADAAFRSRPPSPTARDSSLVSASISSSARSARATFPCAFASSSSSRSSPSRRRYSTFACWSSISPASPNPATWIPAFSSASSPRCRPRPPHPRRRRRACSQSHQRDRAHEIQPPDAAADAPGIRGLWYPSAEMLSRRNQQSSTLPLCEKFPRAHSARVPARRRCQPTQFDRSASRMPCVNFLEKSRLSAIVTLPMREGPTVILTFPSRRTANCHPDDPSNARRRGIRTASLQRSRFRSPSRCIHSHLLPPPEGRRPRVSLLLTKNPTTRAII